MSLESCASRVHFILLELSVRLPIPMRGLVYWCKSKSSTLNSPSFAIQGFLINTNLRRTRGLKTGSERWRSRRKGTRSTRRRPRRSGRWRRPRARPSTTSSSASRRSPRRRPTRPRKQTFSSDAPRRSERNASEKLHARTNN